MMHGHEKSDSAIVAVKPMNKAERSAAESVERRAETEGNVDRQRTRRTQRRISASQMLAHIRQHIVAVDTQGGNRMWKAARTDLCGGCEVTRIPTETAEHPQEFGADANRIAIAGDSVGGNMTAVVALFAKERRGPEIKRSSRTDERHPRQSNSRPLHIALERLAPPEDARRACRSNLFRRKWHPA
jgi:hypothetical protein